MVVEVGDGWVTTIDGNSGPCAGGRVTLHERTPVDHWTAFYDVEPLLQEAA